MLSAALMSERIGDRRHEEGQAEVGAEVGLRRERRMIEITAEGQAAAIERLTRVRLLNLPFFAVGFANENGGGNVRLGMVAM